jgi:nucleoside-diphosphate-sugar epimerase
MKILVTGNMGYLGPLVVWRLRESNPDAIIIGYDMGYFGNCLTTHCLLPECQVDLQYFGDIRFFPEKLLEEIDTIVHLAAISNDSMGNTFEKVTFDINYRSSVAIAYKARAMGVKSFVYASSCSMYGFAGGKPRVESDPLNPLTAYARSKVFTENDIKPLAKPDFVITSLRFSTACGMSDRLRLDLVLNDFVAGAVTQKHISILSDGTPWRPLIDVKDMARAIEWAVNREADNGGEFLAVNVGRDEWNYQVKELSEAVAQSISGIDVSINKDAQPDKRSYRVDFGLYRKLAPHHQPQVNLFTSIKEIEEGLGKMNFKDGNFRNSRYMRLKTLSDLRENGLLDEKLRWIFKSGRASLTQHTCFKYA